MVWVRHLQPHLRSLDSQLGPDGLPVPTQGEANFGDSSWPLFTVYSKIAEEEDNKMVERWQKDTEGLIFFVRPCRPRYFTAY